MQAPAFNVGALLSESWRNTQLLKVTFWPALIVALLVSMAINYCAIHLFHYPPNQSAPYWIAFYLIPFVNSYLLGPLYAGLIMLSVQHFRGEKVSFTTPLRYYRHFFLLGTTMFLVALLSDLGWNIVAHPILTQHFSARTLHIVAVAICTIIGVSISLMLALSADKKLSPWRALATSFQLTKSSWGQILGVFLVVYALIIISFYFLLFLLIVTHGIMLIVAIATILLAFWLVPFMLVTYGAIYHHIVDRTVM